MNDDHIKQICEAIEKFGDKLAKSLPSSNDKEIDQHATHVGSAIYDGFKTLATSIDKLTDAISKFTL